MEPSCLLRAAVFLRVRRWSDWALLLGAHLLHGFCVRLLSAPFILRKWANAWQQNAAIAALGLALGALEDACVCAIALVFYWLIDKLSHSASKNSIGVGTGGNAAASQLPVTDATVSSSPLRLWLADISPLALRFVGYALVFLASNAFVLADGVLVRTRQMRFSTAFVRMYFHERDAAAELQIDDRELLVLYENAALTLGFAMLVGYFGAVWFNLTEWDFLRALQRFRVRRLGWQPTSRSSQYTALQSNDDKDEDDPAKSTEPQPRARSLLRKCSDRLSTKTLLLVLLAGFLTTTIALTKLVPSIVAVLALNTSLSEPIRLLCGGLELFSIRHVTVHKRMRDFVEHETEDATMFSDDALYRRTQGFRGPLAFNIRVAPKEKLNVLVLVIESFRQRDSQYLLSENQKHLLPPGMTLTPQFDKWARQGVAFRNMWSSWRTSRALETILFGQVPYDSITDTGTTNGREDVALSGLPQLFHDKGYECLFTTGTRTDYEDWDTFLPAHGFDHVLDMWDLADMALDEVGIDYTVGDQMMTYWGIHDHLSFDVLGYLLQKRHHEARNRTISKGSVNRTMGTRARTTGATSLDLDLAQDEDLDPSEVGEQESTAAPTEHKSDQINTKKPWFVTHFTISSHVPFDERPDWYHKYSPNIPDFSAFYAGHEHEELLKNYAEMRYYTDLTFGYFMDNLRSSGVLDDTIVVVVGDHGQAPERGSATPEQDQMSATRIAGAIIADGRMGDSAGKILEDVASHSDLLNTIADIVGVPESGFLQSGVGHSLKRAAPFGQRVVHSNNPAVNMAAVQGHTRMQYYSEISDAVQAYHTEFDPAQQHDLMAELSPERLQQIFETCAEGRMLSEYFKYRWDHACILAPEC
ncbi:Sulfatase-like protein [Globisporangium polare]